MSELNNNLIGQKFNKLTIVKFSHKDKKGNPYYECICECGNTKIVRLSHLKLGNVKSCGCIRKERKYDRINDLTGKKFGKLTVLSYAFSDKHRFSHYLCQCECGNKKIINGNSLTSGRTKSCGCIENKANTKHGLSYTRLYSIWKHIIDRCYNKKNDAYNSYGGRGITVYSEWKNNFINFYNWGLKNGYKDNLTIDRIDNSKGYYPDNCRFVNCKIQANNRRSNHYITINNETHSIADWARIYKINPSTISNRLKLGWSNYDSVTKPIIKR